MEFKPLGAPTPAARPVATRTVRKIALFGSHSSSLADAPWDDPSWEAWGHASSRAWYLRAMDRYFDLHCPACRTPDRRGKALYGKWLSRNTVPIYMQRRYPEIPASVAYPKGRILAEFSYAHRRRYFANHVAWMIALAITEGVTHIGLFGVNYSAQSEYATQRGSAEYWLGQLDGRGINVILPDQCSLLAEPALLYGYESHDEQTGKLRDEYKPKWKPQDAIRPIQPGDTRKPAAPPTSLLAEIAAEEAAHPRPEWALGPPAEVLAVHDDGQTHHGEGFSARLVAAEEGEVIPPGNGMLHWRGVPVPEPAQ
jgi:hypothetical protein